MPVWKRENWFVLFNIVFWLDKLINWHYSKLFIAVTEVTDRVSTKSPSDEDITDVKFEPDNFIDSMIDVSEQIENRSDSSILSQNVEKFGEAVTGS